VRFSLFTEIQCPDGSSPETRLSEFFEQAELADRLGFHGFWIAEIHCQPRFSLLSAPYVVLGAVAQRTRNLRLGVAVNTLPVHHPVQLAEQAAMLDLLSHGRMDFAAGGGHPHSRVYECFDVDHKQTHEIMEESLAIILKAWNEDRLTFDGKFFQIPEVVVNPKPVQRPLPPFYMASSSLDGVEVAARLGVNLLLPIHTRTAAQVAEFADVYWAGLQKHGHDKTSRELGLLVPMHLAKTVGEATARAEEGIMSYFKIIADMRSGYIDWLTRRGVELPVRLGRSGAGLPVTYETVCGQHAVVGDSNHAIIALQDLAKRTSAGHFLVWMNIGSLPHALVKESMCQFAAEVLPKF
jgi:alkanesulfonate monooxygenase SsuD/methylene tetrahydromethanopterin reductase-like flavin-dependent oxidoreductase (luciferase family)